MKKAKSKFDFLKQDPNHTWGAPSPEEEQVIALKAEIVKVKDKNLQLSRSLQSKLDKPSNTSANAADSAATHAQGDGGSSEKKSKKKKNRKNRSDKRRQNEDEAWKKVPPKAGEPKQMKKNDKMWNWCMHHQAWCIHTEEACTKGKELAAAKIPHQATVDNTESSISPAYAQLLAYLASHSEG